MDVSEYFLKISEGFRRFPKILQMLSEGHMDISEYFLKITEGFQTFKRFAEDFWGTREDVSTVRQWIEVLGGNPYKALQIYILHLVRAVTKFLVTCSLVLYTVADLLVFMSKLYQQQAISPVESRENRAYLAATDAMGYGS